MYQDYILYRPIMYDVVLDELTCFETMNSPSQLVIMCFAIFLWNLVATVSYIWIYKLNDFDSDSIQYVIVLIPFIKAV